MEFEKHRILLEIIGQLNAHGSWTGKTHIQKTAFILDAIGRMEMPFQFVLYKHGPYSFDVEQALQEMRTYGAVEPDSSSVSSYGMSFKPSNNAEWLRERQKLTPQQEKEIAAVCEFVGTRNVIRLERLATAAWIRKRENLSDPESVANRLHELKPHISVPEALQADEEMASLL